MNFLEGGQSQLRGHAVNTPRSISQRVSQASIPDEVNIQIMHQSNQAVRLIQNYERTGIIEDLNKAIAIIEQVIDMTPQGSVHLAGILSNFGAMLGRRFEQTEIGRASCRERVYLAV